MRRHVFARSFCSFVNSSSRRRWRNERTSVSADASTRETLVRANPGRFSLRRRTLAVLPANGLTLSRYAKTALCSRRPIVALGHARERYTGTAGIPCLSLSLSLDLLFNKKGAGKKGGG